MKSKQHSNFWRENEIQKKIAVEPQKKNRLIEEKQTKQLYRNESINEKEKKTV
jgi:hypothetical protein